MDAELKQLAEAGLAVSAAEDAIGRSAFMQAAEALDRAADGLARLRARWPALSPAQRALIGRTAAPLRARLDDARRLLPTRSALTVAEPRHDPDEDVDRAAAEADAA
jgi:hypothetical protein